MSIIYKCMRLYKSLCTINLWKTIYLNFRIFPIKIAVKFPLKINRHVEFVGVRKNCIQFHADSKIQRFMIDIGDMPYPLCSKKGMYTYFRFSPEGKILLGENVTIRNGANVIVGRKGCISIGNDVFINYKSLIYSNMSVIIDNNVNISWNVQIMDSDHHFVYNETDKSIKYFSAPIVIGYNSWIGNNSIVCKGSKIPPQSILACGSLLNKDFSKVLSRGNLFIGRPAQLKQTGLYRIFNEKFQEELVKRFEKNDYKTLFIDDVSIEYLQTKI